MSVGVAVSVVEGEKGEGRTLAGTPLLFGVVAEVLRLLCLRLGVTRDELHSAVQLFVLPPVVVA